MLWISRAAGFFQLFFRRRQLEDELDEEMRACFEILVDREISPASFTAVLTGTFAALALTLAAIGIYGLLYYSVSRRTREIGVRMALGANRADVIGMVMNEGLVLVGAGIVLGLAGSLLMSRFLSTLVYGVSTLDQLTYAIAIVLLPLAGILGCWRPAHRAATANPVDAIRAE